jgi:reactive chlorine resistance protein C
MMQAQQATQTTFTSRPAVWQPNADRLSAVGATISRYSLVLILFWIGLQKFTAAEAEAIKPLITHSPLMSWMYSVLSAQAVSNLLGVVEVSLALLIASRPLSARASFFGSLGAIGTFLTTVSFLFTTPGVLDHTHAIVFLGAVGGFLIKDLALLGVAIWTAAEALSAFRAPRISLKELAVS